MSRLMPKPDAPVVDGRGLITRPWRDYLSSRFGEDAVAQLQAQIDELARRIDSGGGSGLPNSTRVVGASSVDTEGTLAGGLVTVQLQNDDESPGESFYYGTNASGAKGWHPLTIAALQDVDLTDLANGNVLVYDEALDKWAPGAGGSATSVQEYQRMTEQGDFRITANGDLRVTN